MFFKYISTVLVGLFTLGVSVKSYAISCETVFKLEREFFVESHIKKRLDNADLAFLKPPDHEIFIDSLVKRILRFDQSTRSKALSQASHEDSGGKPGNLTQNSIYGIFYPDGIQSAGIKPLEAISRFLSAIPGLFEGIHILPHHQATSDGGFAPKEHFAVDPRFGHYSDIHAIHQDTRIMFDLVMGHVSASHEAVRGYLNGDPRYEGWFIEMSGKKDSRFLDFIRPRVTPLGTKFKRKDGSKVFLLTTFGPDQVDLNYRNPKVFKYVMDVFLNYIENGADIVRLDAVTYLVKNEYSEGAHQPEVYKVVGLMQEMTQLLVDLYPEAFPYGKVNLLTETNVPHKQNVSYFGKRGQAVHLTDGVYNFALAPLVAWSVYSGNAEVLKSWVKNLDFRRFPEHAVFFNHLDSHDGVSVNGARGLLSKAQINELAEYARTNGAQIGMKSKGGKESPYEIQATWTSLISDPAKSSAMNSKRILLTRAFQLGFKGAALIFQNSLFSLPNDQALFESTLHGRDLNRTRVDLDKGLAVVRGQSEDSFAYDNFMGLKKLIEVRKATEALGPYGDQVSLKTKNKSVVAIKRTSYDGEQELFAIYNFSDQPQVVEIKIKDPYNFKDLLSEKRFFTNEGKLYLELDPYEYLWLSP